MTAPSGRLLVLGAGLFQLPGITRAVELGLEVITVDNVPGNVGHRLADRSVDLSTTDVDGVVALARDLAVDGVVTFSSNVAAEAVAAATGALGRPGPSRPTVRTLSHNGRFRRFQQAAGLPHPDFRVVGPDHEVPPRRAFHDHDAIVVKPADTSGSRGVSILRSATWGALVEAVDAARRRSRTGTAVVEGFLPGIEVGGDGFLRDGLLQRLCLTDKRLDGVVVRGHRYPDTTRTPSQLAAIRAAVEDCCVATDLRDGPINLDVMVDGDEAVVLEMSSRTGGNGIPRLVRLVDGLDLEEGAIRLALGDEPVWAADPPSGAPAAALSHVLDVTGPGTIRHVATEDEVRGADRRIREVWLAARPGDVVDEARVPKGLVVLAVAPDEPEPDLPAAEGWIDLAPGQSTQR